jgi:hypothetical protein
MKHIIGQVMSAAGALLCVLAFWVAVALKAGDVTGHVALLGLPAGVGLYLGFRVGLHGLTLPVYCIALMLALAYARVYPYYSGDLGWVAPPLLYGMLLVPSALLPVLVVSATRGIRKWKGRPNITLHGTQ